MNAPLLEREPQLAAFEQALLRVRRGRGQVLLVHGEAGSGKSRLLSEARELASSPVQWLQGLCEPLASPLPLAPLLDMAPRLPPSLSVRLHRGAGAREVMPALLDWLQQPGPPVVLSFDDMQWADGASLDVVRFLARRAGGLRVLLVLAWRDDEAGSDQALHDLRGALAGTPLQRLALPPLSPAAVGALARGAGRSARGLFAATGGNPFFVHELLGAATEDSTPTPSLRDAVLARAQRLDVASRRALDALSVAPGGLAVQQLQQLGPFDDVAIAALLASGLVAHEAAQLRFRHDIARSVFEQAIPVVQRKAWHRALFELLPAQTTPAALRLHHARAAAAGFEPLLVPAAADAARAGAHCQAAELYSQAAAAATSVQAQIPLLDAVAEQRELIGRLDEALAGRRQLLERCRQAGDVRAEGLALAKLARLLWAMGRAEDGRPLAVAACRCLEPLGPSHELALAWAVRAQLHLLAYRRGEALVWGARAVELAGALRDTETLAHVMITVGTAQLECSAAADQPTTWQGLRDSLALARANGWSLLAARAYLNLVVHGIAQHRDDETLALIVEAREYLRARDLGVYVDRLDLRAAWLAAEAGHWAAARREFARLARSPVLTDFDRQQIHGLDALLALRQGSDRCGRAAALWTSAMGDDEAWMRPPWYAPQVVVLLEACWLLGRRDRLLQLARLAWPAARDLGERWRAARIALWLARLGEPPADLAAGPEFPPACHAELAGDRDGAATLWLAAGRPFAAAQALLGGDADQVARALVLLDRLGAGAVSALARRRLRELGRPGAVRGENRHTRADAQHLTVRQRMLAEALAAGRSNRDIAAQWHRSVRTVEHHVERLLVKLGVGSRHAVAARLATPASPTSDRYFVPNSRSPASPRPGTM